MRKMIYLSWSDSELPLEKPIYKAFRIYVNRFVILLLTICLTLLLIGMAFTIAQLSFPLLLVAIILPLLILVMIVTLYRHRRERKRKLIRSLNEQQVSLKNPMALDNHPRGGTEMKCPKCLRENRPTNRYCTQCGTFLSGTSNQQTGTQQTGTQQDTADKFSVDKITAYLTQHRSKYSLEALKQQILQAGCPPDKLLEAIRKIQAPSPEASEHFQRAMAIDAKEGDIQALNEQAGELSLAIRKANGDYPSAHATLGFTLSRLGDEKRARHECEIALQQENNHVFAHCLLLWMDGEKLGMPGFTKTSSGSFIADVAVWGAGLAVAFGKLNAFSNKIDQLVAAYPAYLSNFINEPDDAGIWIGNSEFMLGLHDAVQMINNLPKKDRIANAIVNAPWDKLLALNLSDEDRKEVDEIRRRAEGRVLLSRAK